MLDGTSSFSQLLPHSQDLYTVGPQGVLVTVLKGASGGLASCQPRSPGSSLLGFFHV